MLKKLFRIVFTSVGAIFGYGVFLLTKYLISVTGAGPDGGFTRMQQIGAAVIFVIIFGLIFFRLTPSMDRQGRKLSKKIESDLQSYSANELISGAIGLVTGLIVAFLISRIYDGIEIDYVPTVLTVITYFVLGYLGVVIASKKGKEGFSTFMASMRSMNTGSGRTKNRQNDATPKIFDTSVIIDGRIADIMKTGFIEGTIVIPEFVLVELRHIADSSDSLKRNRGRRGLDVLNKIQNDYGIDIYNTAGEKSLEEIPERS